MPTYQTLLPNNIYPFLDSMTALYSHNYHTFTPLLYQVATAQLAPEQVAVPIRTILRKKNNINFLQKLQE